MALFKTNMEIAAAMRLAIRAVFQRDTRAALAQVAEAAFLSQEERTLLEEELTLLEVSLWHMRFLEKSQDRRLAIPPQELGRMFGIALMFALRDSGYPEESVEEVGDRLMAGMGEYLDGAFQHGDERAGTLLWAMPTLAQENTAESRPP